jgi:hypothetical protein
MRRMWIAAVMAVCGAAEAVGQQAPPPAVPPTESSFCAAGSSRFRISEAAGLEGAAKCVRGDTILIPVGSGSSIARLCDFTKSMVSGGNFIVCVMQGGARAVRQ